MGAIEADRLFRRHRLKVDDYHRMAELGVLPPGVRVELIEGEVIDMASIGTRHASAVMRLTRLLILAAGDNFNVATQSPLVLGKRSAPEPDLLLLRPRADFYAQARPTAADVLLLIEVSDTTSRYDREIKAPLYARHGVPEVWVIDLDNKRLCRMRAPVHGQYSEVAETATPAAASPHGLPGMTLDLSWLFS